MWEDPVKMSLGGTVSIGGDLGVLGGSCFFTSLMAYCLEEEQQVIKDVQSPQRPSKLAS